MKIKGRIKTNRSFKKKIGQLPEMADSLVRNRLFDIANTAIEFSQPFVQSGAYITSFSFNTAAGRPRGYTLHGRPVADRNERAGVGLRQLIDDINRIQDFSNKSTLYLRNNAPHAYPVELNYRVFAQIKNIEVVYG
jgi:hypothetical protein|tara:strand:+ start:104 stop:511 length:408 start_codon:yes stop_codon:yes gene_type:complete